MPSSRILHSLRKVRGAAAIAALSITLFAFVAACGGGSNGSPTAEPDPQADPGPQVGVDPNAPVVSVDLTEWSVMPDVSSIEAGAVTFSASNSGSEDHELVILKTDEAAGTLTVVDGRVDESAYDEIGEIEEFAPGLDQAATFRLDPGAYVLICNIADHYEEGMYAEFAVEEVTGDLVIYSGREEDLIGPLIDQFEDATGLDVGVRYGSNAQLIATIFEEGGNSPADVFFGSDPGALGALSDKLGVLPADILEQVPVAFRSPVGKWVGVTGRARTVIYNTDTLTEADLPASIFDFTDPEWSGRIGWAPTNGSFQSMVTAMRQLVGEDETRDWLEGIKNNNPTEYPKNTPIVQAVADGEVDVGFVNHYYLHRFLAEEGDSFSARNAFMKGGDPGAVVLVAGAGILESADHVRAAERFIDFLLSQGAQQYFSDETFEYPLVDGVEPQPGLPRLDDVEVPDLDLSSLSDLEGTLALLRDVGVIP